jgi:DNA-binding response OmpR family regulator
MLTARGEDIDKIIGLEIGADDYLAKPFNPRELVARARAVMRRAETGTRRPGPLGVGNLTVDPARREAEVGGGPISLRAKEFDLLMAFVQNPGIALTRDQLLETVWGYEFAGETRTVDVHVQHLRTKLTDATVRIETLRGVGYKLVAAA